MLKFKKHNNLHDKPNDSKLPRECKHTKVRPDGSKDKSWGSTEHDPFIGDKKQANKLHKFIVSSKLEDLAWISSWEDKKLWRGNKLFEENKQVTIASQLHEGRIDNDVWKALSGNG